MIEINFKPYKTTYEGSLRHVQFELEIFRDGNWQIIWVDEFPDNIYSSKFDIEQDIYKYFNENKS